MPSKSHNVNSDGLYEAIRNGRGVSFDIVTGGVKYKAKLTHRDDQQYRAAFVSNKKQLSTATPDQGATRQDAEQKLDELDKYWNNRHGEWK